MGKIGTALKKLFCINLEKHCILEIVIYYK